jgi:hypothetical protein
MTKTTGKLLSLSTLAVLGMLPCAACGGGRPVEAQSASSAMASPPLASGTAIPSASVPAARAEESTPPVATDSTTAAQRAAVLTVDTSTVQRLFDDTTHAPAAVLRAKGATGGDPLARGLRDLAQRVAPGMDPDGPLATGTLKEKQNLQTDVTLQPGKCYAIVGYSKKVRDLDLYLLLPPGILSGQDTTDDNVPVIGGPPQPMCPVATAPVTYKLGVVADQGAGEVAVQLYSKAK